MESGGSGLWRNGRATGSPLHMPQDIFNIPEDAAAAEILVPAAVGDGFGRIVPLVAVGDFEEFIGPAGGLVINTGISVGFRFLVSRFRKGSFEFRVSSFRELGFGPEGDGPGFGESQGSRSVSEFLVSGFSKAVVSGQGQGSDRQWSGAGRPGVGKRVVSGQGAVVRKGSFERAGGKKGFLFGGRSRGFRSGGRGVVLRAESEILHEFFCFGDMFLISQHFSEQAALVFRFCRAFVALSFGALGADDASAREWSGAGGQGSEGAVSSSGF